MASLIYRPSRIFQLSPFSDPEFHFFTPDAYSCVEEKYRIEKYLTQNKNVFIPMSVVKEVPSLKC